MQMKLRTQSIAVSKMIIITSTLQPQSEYFRCVMCQQNMTPVPLREREEFNLSSKKVVKTTRLYLHSVNTDPTVASPQQSDQHRSLQ